MSDDDLGDCAYYARYSGLPGHDPVAICSYGCWDEPQCVTCCPRDGWAIDRAYANGHPCVS